MNINTVRWILIIFGLILNIINYTISPYRVSIKKNTLINISYKNIFFIIYILLFIFDMIYIILLNKIHKPIINIPNIWWIAIMIIFGIYLINLYINSNYYNLDCDKTSLNKCYYKPECIVDTTINRCENKFITKPSIFLGNNIRSAINTIIILVFIISYYFEYYINKNEITNKLSLIRMLSIILIIYITIVNLNYIPCKYGLPANW